MRIASPAENHVAWPIDRHVFRTVKFVDALKPSKLKKILMTLDRGTFGAVQLRLFHFLFASQDGATAEY